MTVKKWGCEHCFTVLFRVLILIYAVSIIFDIIPCSDNLIRGVKNVFPFLDFNLREKASTLVGAYGGVWTVSVGVIVFVVQRGYGRLLGLQMGDILNMYLSRRQIALVVAYFLGKYLVYLAAYCYHWKCTLVLGMAESFLSLAFAIFFFVKWSNLEFVNKLLLENTRKSMEEIQEKGNMDRPKWKIIECAQNMNYESSEECQALIGQVTAFIKDMDALEKYPDEITVKWLIEEMVILKLVTENICFTDVGKARISNIAKQCLENLSSAGLGDTDGVRVFRYFLLAESLMDISSWHIGPELLEEMIRMLRTNEAVVFVEYLLVYLVILRVKLGTKDWCGPYIQRLWEIYGGLINTVDVGDFSGAEDHLPEACRVIYFEYEKLRICGLETEHLTELRLQVKYNAIMEELVKEGLKCADGLMTP